MATRPPPVTTYTVNGQPATKAEYDASQDRTRPSGALKDIEASLKAASPVPAAVQAAAAGNSAPSSTPSAGPNAKPTYNDDIGLPDIHYNPLQNYRNMTYNSRLTMMPFEETTKGRPQRSYDYKNGLVMWETGGAGSIYLEELQMNIAGTHNATGNYYTQQPTKVTGKIVEPVGGRLIESLSLAAMKLGYNSTGVAVYLLEIWFTGYNTDSDMPEVCKGWDGEELVYRWYIRLDTLIMKLDYKGATYDFKGTPIDGAAVLSDHYTLEVGFRMPGAFSTIGQFCERFAKALNDREDEKVKSGIRCIPHKYVITAHKDITNIAFTKSFWQSATSFFGFSGEIQGTPGMAIQQFIVNSIPNSQDMLKYMHRVNDGKKEYNATDNNPGKIHLPIRTLAIIPGCRNIAYDEKLGNTAKEVHYFLTTREEPTAIVSPQDYKDSEDPKNRAKRVDNWIKKGMLRKVYKWNYTGENIEVINTEITIDNLWRNVRPLWIDSNGKAIAPNTAQSKAGTQSSAGKSSSKVKACAEAQTVKKPVEPKPTSYMEDLVYRPTSPQEGWHPTYPPWYHMNTSVQQSSNQGGLSQENAQEYSIYRQVANGMAGSGQLFKLDIDIVGDPYWLMQSPGTPGKPPWEEDVWEYEKEQLTEEKMAEKRKTTSTHTWLGGVYFETILPNVEIWAADDTMALRQSDTITGIYWPYTIVNKFSKGKFTTRISANRDVLSNPWKKTVIRKSADNTKTGKGSAGAAGPNTAATPMGRNETIAMHGGFNQGR